MRTIYRYPVVKLHELDYKHPHGVVRDLVVKGNYQLLYAGIKDGELCLWVQVDPETPDLRLKVGLFATGQLVSEGFRYFQSVAFFIGSKQMFLHVYIQGLHSTTKEIECGKPKV